MATIVTFVKECNVGLQYTSSSSTRLQTTAIVLSECHLTCQSMCAANDVTNTYIIAQGIYEKERIAVVTRHK